MLKEVRNDCDRDREGEISNRDSWKDFNIGDGVDHRYIIITNIGNIST